MKYQILLKKWRGHKIRWIQVNPFRPVFKLGEVAIGNYKLKGR